MSDEEVDHEVPVEPSPNKWSSPRLAKDKFDRALQENAEDGYRSSYAASPESIQAEISQSSYRASDLIKRYSQLDSGTYVAAGARSSHIDRGSYAASDHRSSQIDPGSQAASDHRSSQIDRGSYAASDHRDSQIDRGSYAASDHRESEVEPGLVVNTAPDPGEAELDRGSYAASDHGDSQIDRGSYAASDHRDSQIDHESYAASDHRGSEIDRDSTAASDHRQSPIPHSSYANVGSEERDSQVEVHHSSDMESEPTSSHMESEQASELTTEIEPHHSHVYQNASMEDDAFDQSEAYHAPADVQEEAEQGEVSTYENVISTETGEGFDNVDHDDMSDHDHDIDNRDHHEYNNIDHKDTDVVVAVTDVEDKRASDDKTDHESVNIEEENHIKRDKDEGRQKLVQTEYKEVDRPIIRMCLMVLFMFGAAAVIAVAIIFGLQARKSKDA